MNLLLIYSIIISLAVLTLAWKCYMKSLEHGELKSRFSKLSHERQKTDSAIHILSAAGAQTTMSTEVPVPKPENKGRPWTRYTILTPTEAMNSSRLTTKRELVQCHECKKQGVIATNFPLHGTGRCPYCAASMSF